MTENERILKLVCGSAKRALHSQTPRTLRAYSFSIDHGAKRVLLRAHFGESPSEDDLEATSIVETEIEAGFLDHCEGEMDIEVVASGKSLSFLPGGLHISAKENLERFALSKLMCFVPRLDPSRNS